MKLFIYGLLVGLILSLTAYVWWLENKSEPENDPVIEYVENIHKLDSLNYVIEELTAKLEGSKIAIESKNKVIVVQKKEIAKVKTYADSLEASYQNDRNLELCDSVIMAKNSVIESQDTLIVTLEAQTKEYSNQVCLLNETINTKDKIIFQKDSTIETLSCAYDWKIRRKFLAWLLGWKCNK